MSKVKDAHMEQAAMQAFECHECQISELEEKIDVLQRNVIEVNSRLCHALGELSRIDRDMMHRCAWGQLNLRIKDLEEAIELLTSEEE